MELEQLTELDHDVSNALIPDHIQRDATHFARSARVLVAYAQLVIEQPPIGSAQSDFPQCVFEAGEHQRGAQRFARNVFMRFATEAYGTLAPIAGFASQFVTLSEPLLASLMEIAHDDDAGPRRAMAILSTLARAANANGEEMNRLSDELAGMHQRLAGYRAKLEQEAGDVRQALGAVPDNITEALEASDALLVTMTKKATASVSTSGHFGLAPLAELPEDEDASLSLLGLTTGGNTSKAQEELARLYGELAGFSPALLLTEAIQRQIRPFVQVTERLAAVTREVGLEWFSIQQGFEELAARVLQIESDVDLVYAEAAVTRAVHAWSKAGHRIAEILQIPLIKTPSTTH